MLFYGEDNASDELRTRFFVHRQIKPAIKTVEFISDHQSYYAKGSLV
jgi:hypothetical protein